MQNPASVQLNGYLGISRYDDKKYQANFFRYHWGGIHQPTDKFVTANCPQGSCTFEKSNYAVFYRMIDHS